jgi:hypothetical protein
MKSDGWSFALRGLVVAILATASCGLCGAEDKAARPAGVGASGLYMKVQLEKPLKLSKLKPGDIVEGNLARDIYSSDRELFPAGSHVRLAVDHMEKRRRAPNDHWPGVIKLFTPRHEPYPVFKTATVSAAGTESALQVSVLSISRMREVHAQTKKKKSGQADNEAATVEVSRPGGLYGPTTMATPIMILEASSVDVEKALLSGEGTSSRPDLSVLQDLPAGTRCKILLTSDVSASKSKPGDVVQARLIEPVILNSRVALPAGTLIEGSVLKRTAPRWGSRAGSLALTFSGLTLPGGNQVPISASLAGAELDRRSHTRIDSEGQLRGERPGKAWMAINLAVTAGVAKEADDTFQLIFEAIVSTATDASTAGTARIISSCASGIYMVTRHGRDVVIPRFTEMDISLDRPLAVSEAAQSRGYAVNASGN